jgi:hypothetical protein
MERTELSITYILKEKRMYVNFYEIFINDIKFMDFCGHPEEVKSMIDNFRYFYSQGQYDGYYNGFVEGTKRKYDTECML